FSISACLVGSFMCIRDSGYSGSRSTLFGSCLSASIGLGIAFVGLATLEVGSAGLATGVAAAGFIWASGEWGAACK
ncbi:hypothetical protein, partial [Tenacibaculum maritimum]|uniref:hypothetical protein n=1 Tax=Tenacibaculum maritimum TaxID=107401 RepID=UPI0038777FA7